MSPRSGLRAQAPSTAARSWAVAFTGGNAGGGGTGLEGGRAARCAGSIAPSSEDAAGPVSAGAATSGSRRLGKGHRALPRGEGVNLSNLEAEVRPAPAQLALGLG